MTFDFVTIEHVRAQWWQATLWSADLDQLATGGGVSPQAALQDAVRTLRRP